MRLKPSVEYDFKGLNDFARGLSKNFSVKVGILGNKTSRDDEKGSSTNAEIGLAHEVGSFKKNIPARSFLRMPLFVKSSQILKDAQYRILELLAKGNMKQIFTNLGVACETQIGEAFGSQGFGTWAPLQEKSIERKIGQNPNPLVNTSQLRKSITSKVMEKK